MTEPGAHPSAEDLTSPDPSSLLTPGGKVDPDAVRAAYDRARESGDDEFLVTLDFTINRASLSTRLDKYLTSRVPFMSRNQLQNLIDGGGVRVNDKNAKSSTKLKDRDRVTIVIPPPPSGEIEPDPIPLTVLYEDDHMLVVNKDPDIIVHPARSENRGTMVNALVYHLQKQGAGELSSVGEEYARPGVVHRLDRNTSGCIVFAKTDEAHWKLGRQFEQRTTDKRYLAVTHGWIEPDTQTIDLPIGPHPSRAKGAREKQVVRRDELGKPSLTIARVRERYEWPSSRPESKRQRFTLVELELKTGRTHQIRVHLSHLGYPIVGDDMYTGRDFVDTEGNVVMNTQALHAALLAIEHPIRGEPMVFTAPPRDELMGLIALLRAQSEVQRVHTEGAVPLARFGL